MKTVFFSLKPPNGSYGGGGFFVKNLSSFIISKNYKVIYTLEPNIDVLFIIDPRSGPHKKYELNDFIQYKKNNPNTIIIHRVNECDIKRQISINVEPLLVKTMKFADKVVFVSQWLQNYYINKYDLELNDHHAILNGCNRKHFHPIHRKFNKIKLVTHHWSSNYLKGFHIYNALDQLLPKYPHIEFTYIGNYNKNYNPKNIRVLPCMTGKQLGDELRNHNFYLTATQNEPGAMHYLEGMSCGLPILYCHGGGGAQEICKMAGEEYKHIEELFTKIEEINNNYEKYVKKIDYDYLGSERCCNEYFSLLR